MPRRSHEYNHWDNFPCLTKYHNCNPVHMINAVISQIQGYLTKALANFAGSGWIEKMACKLFQKMNILFLTLAFFF